MVRDDVFTVTWEGRLLTLIINHHVFTAAFIAAVFIPCRMTYQIVIFSLGCNFNHD